MHRIDGIGNVDGMFTEGDPLVPTAPTQITGPWLNAIQEEVVGVITGAGLTLNKADNTQLKQALNILVPKRWGVCIAPSNVSTLADFLAASYTELDDYYTKNGGIMYSNAIPGEFSILFSMVVHVSEATSGSFNMLTSDDATFLYVDGVLAHTYTAGTGIETQAYSHSLSTGDHVIEILHNNAGGDNVDIIMRPFLVPLITFLRSGRV